MVVQQKFAQSPKARPQAAKPATFTRKYGFRAKSQSTTILGGRRMKLSRKMTEILPAQSNSTVLGLGQKAHKQPALPHSKNKPLGMKRLPANRRRCTNFPMIKGARRC
jgi:hypothetical protein